MKYMRYYGEFLDVTGIAWRVEIWQDWHGAGAIPDNAVEISFPGDSPLVLEWPEVKKHEPVQPSTATLKVISSTDRQFTDLYTANAASVRLDVYRRDRAESDWTWTLFWSGTLDTEQYEEPYSYSSGYDVTLTFSDLGVLQRLRFSLSGFVTLRSVIEAALASSGLSYVTVAIGISTHLDVGAPMTLDNVNFDASNFYDEDGEADTWSDVLGYVLQPFALRIVQREGYVWVYDLPWLYGRQSRPVEWTGTDAVLSRDIVYNDVVIRYSPYDSEKVSDGEVTAREDLEPGMADNFLVNMDYSTDRIPGFRLYYGDRVEGSGPEVIFPASFFSLEPINSGDERTGVLWAVRRGDASLRPENSDLITEIGGGIGSPMSESAFFIAPSPVLTVTGRFLISGGYSMRVSLDLLYDVRYNPFEDASDKNEAGHWDSLKKWCNFAYVPVLINFVGEDGEVLGHWYNRNVADSDGYALSGRWVSGEGSPGDAWLAYYDPKDRKSSTGLGGWQTNRRMIGYYRGDLPASFSVNSQGELLDDPVSHFGKRGRIEMTVLSGLRQFDYDKVEKDIYSLVRWVAYGSPSITLVDRYGRDLESEDLELHAWLNRAARETLSIDTHVGTLGGLPTARGAARSGGIPLRTCSRSGVWGSLESLLAGGIYSQYASGKIVLSGTARPVQSLCPLSDGATQGKFICVSEVHDVRAAESKISMSELAEDKFEGIEYES